VTKGRRNEELQSFFVIHNEQVRHPKAWFLIVCLEIKSKYLPIFNVPYRQNDFFTGQTDILKTIHEKLVLNAPPNRTSSYVIYGLGGVGKTQIAIEYSHQHRDNFDIIHWLRADDYETLLASYFQLYEDASFRGLTGLNLGEETDLFTISTRVKSWFENCQGIRWLLVIDNADNLGKSSGGTTSHGQQIGTIANIIPRGRSGCVLVTSRDRAANGQLASDGEELLVMNEDDAKEFLHKCSKAALEESEDAAALVRELGRLPLAIEQAGGFMRETRVTTAEYRRLYKANRTEALREGLSDMHRSEYYRETVSTTWSVSFKVIDQKDSLASAILRIAAFLDGKQLQKDLFYGAKFNMDGNEESLSEWKVSKAFGTLMSYSLVRPVEGRESLEMHLLVQSVIRDDARTDRVRCFMESAKLVQRRFPWGDGNNMKVCHNYLSQAQNCMTIARELQIENDVIVDILKKMAGYLQLTGQFQEAFVFFKRALKIDEREFGVDHINSAGTIHNIANVYSSQGRYADAISYYERALKIYEREFGVDHINSANTLHNIGLLYKNIGDWMSAKSYFERTTSIRRQCLGSEHDFTIDSEQQLTEASNALLNKDLTGKTKKKWWKLSRRR
jgi:tetratricopeptide (TPR) repeat protein